MEIYRRYFVKELNNEYTFVSTEGENAYLSDNEFFKSINDFNYLTPNFFSVLHNYLYDIIFLFFLDIIFNIFYSS